MNRTFALPAPIPSILLACAAGCSLSSGGSVRLGDGAVVAIGATESNPPPARREAADLPGHDQDPGGSPQTAAPEPSPGADGWQDIWSDISVRRRFAESYFPDTEVEPRIEESERAQMQEIMGAISSGKLDWAENLLNAAIGPNSSAVFEFTYGNVWFQREEFERAVRAYREAIEKFPKFRRAWKNLGSCYVRQGDFAGAARAYSKVIQNGGADALTYGLLGYCHAKTDDYIAAESAYRMAALFDPDLIDWKKGLGQSLFQQRRYAEVTSLLDSMLAENSHLGELWLMQANAYLGLSNVEKAAENFEIVDHLGQSTVESLNTLGDIYVNREMFELALGAYERAIAKDTQPSAKKALRNAKVLIQRRANAEGKQLLARIQSQFGEALAEEDQQDLLKLQAKVAMADGKSDEQARILEAIVAMDPLDGEALVLLGQYHAKKGESDRAILRYETAANIPGFEADAKMCLAQLYVRAGDYQKALPLLRRVQVLDPRESVQEWIQKVERYAQGGQ